MGGENVRSVFQTLDKIGATVAVLSIMLYNNQIPNAELLKLENMSENHKLKF